MRRGTYAALARLHTPVLLVQRLAGPRPMWTVVRLAQTLPEARLVCMPGAGHYPHLEDRFRQAMQAFLKRADG